MTGCGHLRGVRDPLSMNHNRLAVFTGKMYVVLGKPQSLGTRLAEEFDGWRVQQTQNTKYVRIMSMCVEYDKTK